MTGEGEKISSEKPRFNGTVRFLRESDLPLLRPILETWVIDMDTREPIQEEIEDDLDIMRKSILHQNERKYFVAEAKDGKVVGVIGMALPGEQMRRFATTQNPVELVNAFVDANERRSGVGTALVAKLEEEARKNGYTEIILNSGPRYKFSGWGFYQKLKDFIRLGAAKNYYGQGYDAQVWHNVLI